MSSGRAGGESGAGLEGGGASSRSSSSSGSSKPRWSTHDTKNFKHLLQGLQSEDPTEQLASLTSLNDLLTYSTDEGLLMGGFSGTQSIPLLVSRIMESSDPTILLLATKTLTQMFDLVPPTIITAAQAGAPQALCEKLLAIEYIDVAEQAIMALEKISSMFPQPVVGCGGMMALLCYLEFFSMSIQRIAVQAVANCCSDTSIDHQSQVEDATPVVISLLNHHDTRIVESAVLGLVRILEGYTGPGKSLDLVRAKVETLLSHGLLGHAATLLATALPENASAASIDMSPYLVQLLLRLVSILARHSVTACNDLIDLGILSVIHALLGAPAERHETPCHSPSPSRLSSSYDSPSGFMRRREGRPRSRSCGSPNDTVTADDTLFRALNLLDDLLPDLPQELHPLAGGEQVEASVATVRSPSSSSPAAQESSDTPGPTMTIQHLRIIAPGGALVYPTSSRSSSSSTSAFRLEYGTVVLSSSTDQPSCGGKRYSVPGGWLTERSREDGEVVCRVLGSIEAHKALASAKREFLMAKEDRICVPILKQILPVVLSLHQTVVGPHLKALSRFIIHKALYHVPSVILESVLMEDANLISVLSNFIFCLTSSRRDMWVVAGLQIANVLVEKVPHTMGEALVREGIVSAAQSHVEAPPEGVGPAVGSPVAVFAKTRAGAGPESSFDQFTQPFLKPLCQSLVDKVRRVAGKGGEELIGTPCGVVQSSPLRGEGGGSVLEAVSSLARTLESRGRAETLNVIKGVWMHYNSTEQDKRRCCWSEIGDRKEEEEDMEVVGAIDKLCSLLASKGGVSNYELMASGVVRSLLEFLSASELGELSKLEEHLPGFQMSLLSEPDLLAAVESELCKLRRRRACTCALRFRQHTYQMPSAAADTGRGSESCMLRLVSQLHACLVSSDRFPILLSSPMAAGQGYKGINALLSQPLKLKIKYSPPPGMDLDPDVEALLSSRGMLSFSILIEPLASISAIRDFLEKKITATPTPTERAGLVLPPRADLPPPPPPSSSTSSSAGEKERKERGRGNKNKSGGGEETGSTDGGTGFLFNSFAAMGGDDGEGEEEEEEEESSSGRHLSQGDREDAESSPSLSSHSVCHDDDDDTSSMDEVVQAVPSMSSADGEGDDTSDTSSEVADKENANRQPRSSGGSLSSRAASMGSGGAAAAAVPKCPSESKVPATNAKSIEKAMAKLHEMYDVKGMTLRINDGVCAPAMDQSVMEIIHKSFRPQTRGSGEHPAFLSSNGIWHAPHSVTYTLPLKDQGSNGDGASDIPCAAVGEAVAMGLREAESSTTIPTTAHDLDLQWWSSHPVDRFLQVQGEGLPDFLGDGDPEYAVLLLLRTLYGISKYGGDLGQERGGPPGAAGCFVSNLCPTPLLRDEVWINRTLSERLALQLRDAVVLTTNSLPSWPRDLIRLCPFLIDFSVRKEFFYATAFGVPRALYRLSHRAHQAQQEAGGNRQGGRVSGGGGQSRSSPLNNIQHLKVVVPRDRLLAAADKVLEKLSTKRMVLEVEFAGEPGTGTGPTAEFFSLVSKEIQNPTLGLWREEGVEEGGGLFPKARPLMQGEDSHLFRSLGRLIGQALQDERLLDVRFAAPLLAALSCRPLAESVSMALMELATLDPSLARQMKKLADLARAIQHGVVGTDSAQLDGVPIEDLCLSFCLPGDRTVGLLPTEDSCSPSTVTPESLALYVQRVLHMTLRDGVVQQMAALRQGLEEVVSPQALSIFNEDEIMSMIAGEGSEFGDDPDEILDAIACDHGYTRGSVAVRWLAEILASMDSQEQRGFLMFVTGSPRLPLGGLRGLEPRLTVVKKVDSSNHKGQQAVDAMLPSASTCTNYLKLPSYSSREVARERLLYSVKHGQHSFHLS